MMLLSRTRGRRHEVPTIAVAASVLASWHAEDANRCESLRLVIIAHCRVRIRTDYFHPPGVDVSGGDALRARNDRLLLVANIQLHN